MKKPYVLRMWEKVDALVPLCDGWIRPLRCGVYPNSVDPIVAKIDLYRRIKRRLKGRT